MGYDSLVDPKSSFGELQEVNVFYSVKVLTIEYYKSQKLPRNFHAVPIIVIHYFNCPVKPRLLGEIWI